MEECVCLYFEDSFRLSEWVAAQIQDALQQIQSIKRDAHDPVLKILSRQKHSAIMYTNNRIELDADRMTLISVRYPSERFRTLFSPENNHTSLEIYETVLQEIHQGLISKTVSKKRDIYYRNVELYKNQSKVDNVIEDIACSLGVPRRCLNVIAGSKGLVAGNLKITLKSGVVMDCSQSGDQVELFLNALMSTRECSCLMIMKLILFPPMLWS